MTRKITLQKIVCLVSCICCLNSHAQTDTTHFPFQDYNLPFEARVNDLVSRLTLEEKVAQMLNHAPAIPRLSIPAYDWWNEVLHGVARTPYHTTVYPQAIAMAATWDTGALHLMAEQSALEGRVVHNKAIAEHKTGDRYLGLTYWTPNINIFRDPRWGRGQETYGEDPYLTATLGKAFVRGLQGNDPNYLQAAACAKHYAVHSGPEPSRHLFNVNPSKYDLWNTYLPAFKTLVTEADVAGVMCAYNAFNNQPCCGSDELMIDILRRQWQFNGYVTSDCWAIDDFFKHHKTHPTAEAASADAVFHGTDVECGTDTYLTLVNAVHDGTLPEKQIDTSVKRLFMIRFRLGMFDPVSMVKYAQTPDSVLEAASHKAHALQMARESIVLLQNNNHTLPLSKSLKKIAVIGPNADNRIAVLGNYNGTPSQVVTALQGIQEKVSRGTQIIYEQAVNFTNDTLLSFIDISRQYSYHNKAGVQAEYFAGTGLQGEAAIVREADINHVWQEGETVTGQITANQFSARYTTNFKPDADGTLTFEAEGDDGYRFFINDTKVIDAWERNRWGAKTYQLAMKKDSVYKLVVEYWQGSGKGNIKLRAGNYHKTNVTALANSLKDADAIIFVGGISPQLEGEEMPVNYPGFTGGDRTSILLPSVQTRLLQALQKTGKPVVFVMMTGSAVATPWESEHLPAIVNAWYGGQSAGTALADVLFGDYNPAGRLPVTFYKSDNDLPSFEDYSMTNRTYRYFNGKPLYPFGYGLSYTTFSYDHLTVPATASAGSDIPVSVTVTNTGKRNGDEVVQLYLSYQGQKLKMPRQALKAFQRIYLTSGEQKTLHLMISKDDLAMADESGTTIYPTGALQISVGGGQPGTTRQATSEVLQKTVTIKEQ